MVKHCPCECEARKPSVACCLGEVIKTVTRLTCDDLLNDQAGDGASRAALLKRSKNRSSEKEARLATIYPKPPSKHDIFCKFTAPQRESAYQLAMTDAELLQHTP
jgi:hypothetical protein